MVKKSLKIGIACLIFACLAASGVLSKTGTSIFTVYGHMYQEDGQTLVAEPYKIIVSNITNGLSDDLILGQRDGIGRYSITWIDYIGSHVVEEDDVLIVSVQPDGIVYGCTHVVSMNDISLNRVNIDICLGQISVVPFSWGAIKSIYKDK